MTPEQIRNQCEDDADHTPSDLTVWRDRGVIIAAQQTRISRVERFAKELEDAPMSDWRADDVAKELREALS